MKTIRAILIGFGIWGIAVSFFMLSYYLPILDNVDQQANIVLSMVILPLVWLGSNIYYKKSSTHNGGILGLIFFLVAAILDAIVTVPLFIIPNGGSHFVFFTDPKFWMIAIELAGTAILYYYFTVYPKTKTLNL